MTIRDLESALKGQRTVETEISGICILCSDPDGYVLCDSKDDLNLIVFVCSSTVGAAVFHPSEFKVGGLSKFIENATVKGVFQAVQNGKNMIVCSSLNSVTIFRKDGIIREFNMRDGLLIKISENKNS